MSKFTAGEAKKPEIQRLKDVADYYDHVESNGRARLYNELAEDRRNA